VNIVVDTRDYSIMTMISGDCNSGGFTWKDSIFKVNEKIESKDLNLREIISQYIMIGWTLNYFYNVQRVVRKVSSD